VHIYIGFETLKVKCTQYGICTQAAFKNARAMFYSKLGGAGNKLVGFKKFPGGGKKICGRVAPRPDLTPLIVCRGGTYCLPKIGGDALITLGIQHLLLVEAPIKVLHPQL
jgi:hypothetical protein